MKVRGRDVGFQTTKEGEFWRILLPGIYTMEVFAEGYAPREVQFAIVEQNPTMLNVTLYQVFGISFSLKRFNLLLQDTPRRDGNANNENAEDGKPSGLFSFNPLSGLKEGASNLLAKLPFVG